MTERLRAEYEQYLQRYDLKPRRLPPRHEPEMGLHEIVQKQYEEAKSRNDPMAESILTAYEKNRERYLAETRHPATIAIAKAAAGVETTIAAIPAFAEKFHDDVFVGEFPTGSINCETVKVDGGFLVLVSSGTLTMLHQVTTFLCRGDADHPTSQQSLDAADGIAAVLASYVENGDPFYGPKPLVGGMLAMLSGELSAAAMKFVVAHEYAHILAGHLTEPNPESTAIETEVGAIEVLRKSREQEFEADEIGYRLTLGVADYDKFDLKPIDAGRGSNNPRTVHFGIEQKCLIAAPFVPLTVDIILGKFNEAANLIGNKPRSPETYPPASDRIEKLMALRPGASPRYSGFINIPFMLLPSVERILNAMFDRVFRQARMMPTNNESLARDEVQPRWIQDIMRCVENIRGGDYSTAALVLTDAFEKQRTIFEPDVDVVRRELVRAALGRKTDTRRMLLDRHRDRRAFEQLRASAGDDPLTSFAAERMFPGRRSYIPDIAAVVSNEAPDWIKLVKTALEETPRSDKPRADLCLLDAVLSAWRGEREQSLSSFEAALRAGATDAGGLLARFVVLEKRALGLAVELDIQKLLTAVALNALGEKGVARQLAELVKAYTDYLGIPLGPLAQRMVDTQMQRTE